MKIEVKCKSTNMKLSALNYFNKISDTPKCRHKDDLVLVAKKGQQAVLSCDMDADLLSDIKFRWTFNASDVERFVEVGFMGRMCTVYHENFKERKIEQEGSVSRLIFTPRSSNDFGTFICSAENRVGEGDPCTFILLPVGQTKDPRNCFLSNVTSSSAEVGI